MVIIENCLGNIECQVCNGPVKFIIENVFEYGRFDNTAVSVENVASSGEIYGLVFFMFANKNPTRIPTKNRLVKYVNCYW